MSMVTKFVLWSILLLVLVGATGVKSQWNNQNSSTHDFMYWQDQYKTTALKLTDDPVVQAAIKSTAEDVNQVTVVSFPLIEQDGTTQQRVDRCQSCHVGLLDPHMTAEKIIKAHDNVDVTAANVVSYLSDPAHRDTLQLVEVIGAHPGMSIETAPKRDLGVAHSPLFQYGVATESSPTPQDAADYVLQKASLKKHPFPTFGCTTCHYGSGREMIQNKAHGDPEHWLQPLLPVKYMEAACAQCHATYDRTAFKFNYLPQMKTIARGQQLFKSMACYGCHKIEGISNGNIGPELTYEGRTSVPAAIEHQIWDPKYKVQTCVMPYFFSVRQPQAITSGLTDPRFNVTVQPATIDDPPTYATQDILDSVNLHGYIPNAAAQADVDALVTYVYSQTGQSYASSLSDRMSDLATFNSAKPTVVGVSVAEGKTLFDTSGCYACHYVGDVKHPQVGKGGHAAPELTWEGTRHSVQYLIGHYKNPQEYVPGSIMPIFPFSDSQRAALALYDQTFGAGTGVGGPVQPSQDMPTPKQAESGVRNQTIRYMSR